MVVAMTDEEVQNHPDLTLQVHRAKEGWFWFAKLPGILSHSASEHYDDKEMATTEGLKVYPKARVKT